MYLFLISAVLFVMLDSAFLWTRRRVITKQVEDVQGEPMNPYTGAALASYALVFLGLNYFILYPRRPIIDAFLLGFLVNGTLELNNFSIFKKWSFDMVVIDTLWGGTLWALTTFLTYQLADLINV